MNEKMMKFKNTLGAIFNSLTKQKVILVVSIMAAAFGVAYTYVDWHNTVLHDNLSEIFYAFLFGTLCCIPASYLTDKLKPLKKYLIQVAAAVVTTGMAYLIMHFVKEDSFKEMYILGLAFAVICFTVFILVPRENNKAYYANIFKYFLFCGLISLLGFAGCSLLVSAFSWLLVEINDMDELITSIFIIFAVVFFVNLYVFYLFEKREEPSGKAFKIIFMYVALPVYGLLLLVLYSYLIKMLFTLSVPKGQINWFVSYATAFYLVLYFILQEYRDHKVMKFFYRFGAIVMLPLVAVQFWAYFVRLNAYGFTGWRYTSLLYNLFVTVFLVFTFIKKGKFVKYAIPVLGLIGIFASLTPANLINVAYNSQFKRMTKIMEKYGLWENGGPKLENNKDLDFRIEEDDRTELIGAWRYLIGTSEHKKPDWMYEGEYSNYKSILNIHYDEKEKYLVEYDSEYNLFNSSLDISGFATLEKKKNNFYGKKYGDEEDEYKKSAILDYKQYDCTEKLINHKDKNKPLIIDFENGDRVIFENIDYQYDTEKKAFITYSLEYYILYAE